MATSIQSRPRPGKGRAARLSRRLARIYWPALLWSAAAGAAGGLLGWLPGELETGWLDTANRYADAALYFLIISAVIGALLGALPGLHNRSRRQAMRGALTGGLIGGAGGAAGGLLGQYAFNALGDGLLARAVGWGIVGTFIGLCPGAATRDHRRAARGLIGGLLGGFMAGLLFNLVWAAIPHSAADTGMGSRLVADVVVGLCIGMLVAFVEVVLKRAWLRVVNGRREGAQFILSKDATSIGRDDRDNVILWGDRQMATRHARITRTRGDYLLDLVTPEAPTLLNLRPLNHSTRLTDGDEITLGSTRLVFHTDGAPEQQPTLSPAAALPTPTPTPTVERPAGMGEDQLQMPALPAVAPVASADYPPAVVSSGFRLAGTAPGATGYSLPRRAVLTVGRIPGNDIVLDDAAVSGRHAELRWEHDRWIIYDLGSSNGTYVSYSGAPEAERQVERNALKEGSTLRFGAVTLRLERA